MIFFLTEGKDTLRCLALATVDEPPTIAKMNLEDSATFANYEVNHVLSFNAIHTLTLVGCDCYNNNHHPLVIIIIIISIIIAVILIIIIIVTFFACFIYLFQLNQKTTSYLY